MVSLYLLQGERKVRTIMKTSPPPSKPVNVCDSLHQHLHIYALAASAAGVSVLALAQPSEADGTTDFKIHDFFTGTSFAEIF
jgi:hypothetical protein